MLGWLVAVAAALVTGALLVTTAEVVRLAGVVYLVEEAVYAGVEELDEVQVYHPLEVEELTGRPDTDDVTEAEVVVDEEPDEPQLAPLTTENWVEYWNSPVLSTMISIP